MKSNKLAESASSEPISFLTSLYGCCMRHSSIRARSAIAAAVALASIALAACADKSPLSADARALTVSFTTRATSASSSIGEAELATAAAAVDSVILSKAQLVVREIELDVAANATCALEDDDEDRRGDVVAQDKKRGSNSGDDHKNERNGENNDRDDDECVDVELDPILVDLPLNNQVQTRFQTAIPEGDYREIELRIDKPQNDDVAGRAFIATHPMFKDVSVLAEGTYQGKPFRYLARVKVKLEFEFRPPLAVGPSGTNITVRVLVGRWFRAANGAPIDPATAVGDGPNAKLVERNIAASIGAFADDNRDGVER